MSSPEQVAAPSIVALVVTLLYCGVPASLAAQPAESFDELSEAERTELESHVQTGLEAYDRRNFEKSIGEFQQALELFRHPDFVYRIALGHERLGREKKALKYYRRFLEMAPESDDRDEVERTIDQLKKEIERQRPRLEVQTDPAGAVVRLSGRQEPLGRTRLETRLDAGDHELSVSKSGYRTIEREIELEQGESLSLDYDLEPNSENRGVPTGAVLLFGGGGLAAGGSVASYLQFRRFRSTVRRQKSCIPDCTKPEAFDRNVRYQKTYEGLAWGSAAVAAAAVTGGVLWLALRGKSERAHSRVSISVTPRLSTDFVGIGCSLRAAGR